VSGSSRSVRGGSWSDVVSYLAASNRFGVGASFENVVIGFRAASAIPEPGTGLLVMAGLAGLALRRRRPAQAL
jgi:hypothetical protein